MTDLYMNLLMSAQDGISSVLANIGGNFGPLGDIMAKVTATAADFGVASVKAAGDFQQSMKSLVTGAGEAQGNLATVSAGVLKMATDTGTSTDQLSKGLYLLESSGKHGADGLLTLKAAAEGAKVGNADLAVTANALSTIMTDYHQPASAATADMNALTATVADGKTHLQDLASSMSAVLPLASSLGIQFPQVGGALATMTNAGMSAQNASQNLANALRSLAAPGNKAIGAMTNVGISAQQMKDTLTTQGLTGALQLVEDHVGNKFPAGSVQAVEAFKAIMGGATGYNVALMLGGQNMSTFEGNVKSITGAMDAGGNSVQGWAAVQDTLNFQVGRAQAAFESFQISLGTVFLPIVTQVVGFVADAISGFVSWEQSTGFLQNAMSGISTVIQDVLNVIHGGFGGLPDLATGWGQNMVTGFANGVLSALDNVVAAVVQVVDEISNYLGFMSPAKKGIGQNLMLWPQNMIEAFASGMIDNADMVEYAANVVANKLAPLSNAAGMAGAAGAGIGSAASAQAQAAASAGGGPTGMGVINMSGMTIAQAKQVAALLAQNAQLKSLQGKAASSSQTHAATQAAAAQKHAAAQAATAAKHEAAVSKHNAALAAAATKKEAAAAKHQQVLEAAAAKHQEVMARKAAAAAKKAGGGISGPAVAGAVPNIPKLPNLDSAPVVQQAQKAGQNVAQAYSKGLSTVKNAIAPELAGLNSFITSTLNAVVPLIKPSLEILVQVFQGVWNTIKIVAMAVTTNLLPAIGHLVAVIAPVVIAIVTWIAKSGIIKTLFAALGVVINIVVGILSGIINGIASVIAFFTQTQVGIAIFQAVLVLLGLIGVAIAAIAIVIYASMIPAFIAWVAGAIAVGIANVVAFAPIILIVLAVIAVIALVIGIVKNWGAICAWLQGVWGSITTFFNGMIVSLAIAFTGFGALVAGIWQGMVDGFKSAINWMIGGINGFIGFLNGLHIDIPRVDLGPVHMGGGSISLPHLNTIPMLAKGGIIARSGGVIVGEAGPEMLNLPTGARVTPLGAGGGGGQTINYYITVPAVSTSNVTAAREQGKALGREMANMLRGSGITPTLVSGGLQ